MPKKVKTKVAGTGGVAAGKLAVRLALALASAVAAISRATPREVSASGKDVDPDLDIAHDDDQHTTTSALSIYRPDTAVDLGDDDVDLKTAPPPEPSAGDAATQQQIAALEQFTAIETALTDVIEDLQQLAEADPTIDLRKTISAYRALQQQCTVMLKEIVDSSGSQRNQWPTNQQLQIGMLNLVGISPSGSSGSVISFSNYIKIINTSNNLQTLTSGVSGLPFQGGGTLMAPAIQAAYNQLASEIGDNPTVPRIVAITSDFMVDDPDAVKQNIEKMVSLAQSPPGITLKIELMAVSGIDGINLKLVTDLEDAYPGIVNGQPTYSSLTDALNQIQSIQARLCPPIVTVAPSSSSPSSGPSQGPVVAPTAAPFATPSAAPVVAASSAPVPAPVALTASPVASDAPTTDSPESTPSPTLPPTTPDTQECYDGFSLLGGFWPALYCIPFIPPALRKRQEFTEPNEADADYIAARDKLAQAEDGGFAAATANYQRQLEEHQAALAEYERAMLKYREDNRAYEAELAARRAAGTWSRMTGEDAPARDTGRSGFVLGQGDRGGGVGATSGNIDREYPRVRYEESEAGRPRRPIRPTAPDQPPAAPTARHVRNLVYVGTSTPISLLPVTLFKGILYRTGYADLDGNLREERAEYAAERMPRNLVPEAVKSRLPDRVTGAADAALLSAGQGLSRVGEALPSPVAMLGKTAIALADSALRFASLTSEQRMLQKGDIVQFDAETGEMLRIARKTNNAPPDNVLIIDLNAAAYTPAAQKTIDKIRRRFNALNVTIPRNASPDTSDEVAADMGPRDEMVDVDLETGGAAEGAAPAPFLPASSAVFASELLGLQRMREEARRAMQEAQRRGTESDDEEQPPRGNTPGSGA